MIKLINNKVRNKIENKLFMQELRLLQNIKLVKNQVRAHLDKYIQERI